MVLVQDLASAKFDGMPRSAADTGLADVVLPPAEMPATLVQFINHPSIADLASSDLHCIWRMPETDGDYSGRWREIKKQVSGELAPASDGRNERAFWQRRFWEHLIRDEQDWRNHMDCIHYNPVKHGHCKRPADWPWSSIHRAIKVGWYDKEWGAAEPDNIRGMDLE
jgi:putative transposase